MKTFLAENFNYSANLVEKVSKDEAFLSQLSKIIDVLVETCRNKNIIYSCGNGGSMADAIHFAEEMSGRFQDNRAGLPAIAISDPGHISCVGNDYGYDFIFSRFLESVGKENDILFGVSTSGKSKNVIEAVKAAKKLNIKTICLLGKDGGELKDLCDYPLIVPDQITHRIQEIHIQCIHNIIEGVEREIFPQNY